MGYDVDWIHVFQDGTNDPSGSNLMALLKTDPAPRNF